MSKNNKPERRQYKRYQLKNRIFALVRSGDHQLDRINSMSRGQIAFAVIKSNPTKMGRIVEISRGGLSFHYIENETDLDQFAEMDILFTDENFHLRQVPFKLIKDSVLKDDMPFDALNMKRLAVQFKGLTAEQKLLLEHMLENYTADEVSEVTN